MTFALENAITGRKPRPGDRRVTYLSIARAVPCADHLGRRFPSRAAMAEAWGLPPNMLTSRLAGGWPLEKALTVPPGASRCSPVSDHLGRVFPSFRAMARAWGMSYDTLWGRLHRGYSLRRALTVPVRGRSV